MERTHTTLTVVDVVYVFVATAVLADTLPLSQPVVIRAQVLGKSRALNPGNLPGFIANT